MEALFSLVKQLLILVAPWRNETAAQKVGSIITLLAAIFGFLAYVAQQAPQMQPPVPAPATLPDQGTPSDLDVPAVVDPDVAPSVAWTPRGAVYFGKEALGVVLTGTMGCSLPQATKDHLAADGFSVAACLAGCGLNAAQVAGTEAITGMAPDGGAIGGQALACAEACAVKAGLSVLTELATAPWGGDEPGKGPATSAGWKRVRLVPKTAASK